ncbi:MAG: 16S rRNA (cytidine(1402)-2'-O)-methyltransferase [Tenericutes bacterium]|nr:16S rRNA (cytidine(1402)-2'-O)-methyltransferase [Mycoplasmatota bacterium]MDD7630044.1 16S rRNA (cytidine(1402)-2'-O)-methyltransferase [bacterium]MDY4108829.1 16S rRNA (cytidine(1402)-2'-O)-methyltransferase [Bacilli bacterium]
MNQKSYDGSPTLYLVPTPIGNLGDFTFRAVEVLNQVEVIFSEDTRVTINLLNHYDIKKKLIAFHKFNEEQKVGVVLSYLEDGKSVAIVSDRGTPVLSDPGEICTKKVIEKGYNVVSLPGATAAIPAITASGLDSSKFIFYGFLNSKSSKRKKELEFLKNNKMTIIFYEAPHRIMEMLADLKEVFGNRNISISREISKKFEEIYRATISEVMNMLTEIKGEFVIVVEGNKDVVSFDDITIKEHVNMYMEDGLTEKEAIKKVAKERNMSKSDIYKEVKINN